MSLRGSTLGPLIGALIGAVVGSIVPGIGTALGADVGPVPPVTPRLFPCPSGLARLVNPLLQVPFLLGSRDPARGTLDCLGLMAYLLKEGRGVTLPEDPQGRLLFPNALTPVWVQTGHNPSWWLRKIKPWDVLLWVDSAAAPALGWDLQTQGPLAHCGVIVSDEIVVSTTTTTGVSLFLTHVIADHFGAAVVAVLRPPAPARKMYGPVQHL
jgi:hypothetical protein